MRPPYHLTALMARIWYVIEMPLVKALLVGTLAYQIGMTIQSFLSMPKL